VEPIRKSSVKRKEKYNHRFVNYKLDENNDGGNALLIKKVGRKQSIKSHLIGASITESGPEPGGNNIWMDRSKK